MGKKSLGRSLSSIFKDHGIEPEAPSESGDSAISIISLNLSLIDPNPYQPRKVFSDDEIIELAETIEEHGLIQPITVRKHSGRYQIVAGERRFRAIQSLGWEEIQARVFDMLSDKSMMEWALIENIQRVNLDPIEESSSYQRLLDNHGYTHENLAKRLGKSRSAITNSLRLQKLPATVQTWIQEGKLSAGHARNLLSPEISDPEKVAREIIDKGLSVREVEGLNKHSKNKASTSSEIDPNLEQLIKDIKYALGTQVKIQQKKTGQGQISIEFHNNEDLTRICEIIFQASGTRPY